MERVEMIKLADSFKIRASGASNIMGIKGLGKTGEAFLTQWLKEAMYGRREDIKSKYIEKGNKAEEDAFTLLCVQKNLGMVYKNTKLFENDYAKGTPDLIKPKLRDTKCSWSLDTFPMFTKEIPNQDYWHQLQVYMYLTGERESELNYTLIDAPLELIEREIKWCTSQDEIWKRINNMVYTADYAGVLFKQFCPDYTLSQFIEIPEEDRIKTFEIAYEEDVIKKLEGRVIESRIFLTSLINNL